jgi:hypothetical protein
MMSDEAVLLQIPSALYERMRQVAEDSDRRVENVLLDSLILLYGDLPTDNELNPQTLETFTDDQLWAIVYRPLALPQDARLRQLTQWSKNSTLSDSEQEELEKLVDSADHFVLLRSQALLLLKQRGHDVERRLKLGA